MIFCNVSPLDVTAYNTKLIIQIITQYITPNTANTYFSIFPFMKIHFKAQHQIIRKAVKNRIIKNRSQAT